MKHLTISRLSRDAVMNDAHQKVLFSRARPACVLSTSMQGLGSFMNIAHDGMPSPRSNLATISDLSFERRCCITPQSSPPAARHGNDNGE